jgi:hypothetical protein
MQCTSGLACDPTGRCGSGGPIVPDEPTDEVDLLLVVDNSNSMAEEQSFLIDQLPRLVTALATTRRT